MILINKSKWTCGHCGNVSKIEWDLDLVEQYRGQKGIFSKWEDCESCACKNCGNTLSAKLWMREYPEGVLEKCGIEIVEEEKGNNSIEIPNIQLFDL